MGWMFGHASRFNQELNAWNVSRVTSTYAMFYYASSFNQDLCPWGKIPTFPYDHVNGMFSGSGCTHKSSPSRTNKGPFCASVCIVLSESPLSYATDGDNWDDDNLYSNSNKSPNDPIANESHKQSVQATATYALTGASTSSTSSSSSADKPPKQICYYPGNKKCPKVPQKSTASSCSCK